VFVTFEALEFPCRHSFDKNFDTNINDIQIDNVHLSTPNSLKRINIQINSQHVNKIKE